MRISVARTAVAVVSFMVVATCIMIIAAGMAVDGDWVEIDGTDSLTLEREGPGLVLRGEVELRSNMRYDMEDLRVSIRMTDDARGSRATILDMHGISLASSGTTVLNVCEEIPIQSALLIARDRLAVDGAPLQFRLSASCSYLMGLASFSAEAVLEVPVVAEGEVLSWRVVSDEKDNWTLAVDGLAEHLVPDPHTMEVSGGGETARISVAEEDGSLIVSVACDSVLDGVLRRISAAEDMVVTGADWGRGTVEAAGEVLDAVRSLRSPLRTAHSAADRPEAGSGVPGGDGAVHPRRGTLR